MTFGNNPETDGVPEELKPDVNTIQILEDGERKYRLFLTQGGQLACERFDAQNGKWVHLALRELTDRELRDSLSMRLASPDEEIARAISQHKR